MDKWSEMLDRVELHDPGQMEIAGIVSAQFSQQAKELGFTPESETIQGDNFSPGHSKIKILAKLRIISIFLFSLKLFT